MRCWRRKEYLDLFPPLINVCNSKVFGIAYKPDQRTNIAKLLAKTAQFQHRQPNCGISSLNRSFA